VKAGRVGVSRRRAAHGPSKVVELGAGKKIREPVGSIAGSLIDWQPIEMTEDSANSQANAVLSRC
jgi:hypothetical protein